MTRVTTFPRPCPPPPTAPSGRGGEGARGEGSNLPLPLTPPPHPLAAASSPRSLLQRAIQLPPPAKSLSDSERLRARPGTGVRWSGLTTPPFSLPEATGAARRLHFPGSVAPESQSGAGPRGAMHAGLCSPAGTGTLRSSLRTWASRPALDSSALRLWWTWPPTPCAQHCSTRVARSDRAASTSLGSAIEGRCKPQG